MAATSQDGIPEAFSLGADKIGIQFHPENLYGQKNYDGLNRHKQLLDNVFGLFEGHYRSMQYAKKMGIDKTVAKTAIRKINQELIDHLEGCMSNSKKEDLVLSGKEQKAEYSNDIKTITFLPGITPEDIAIAREGDKNLKVYFVDGESGEFILLDRYDSEYLEKKTVLKFADGSTIELDPREITEDQTFWADDLVYYANKP